METKEKINKWDLIKLKNICTAKEAINKMKIQLREWKKIIANDATNKGLHFQNIQTAHTTQQQQQKKK